MAKLFVLIIYLLGLYIGLKLSLWVGQMVWDFIGFIL